jgi:antagonist of KipI
MIRVRQPGIQTTVQDLGRMGWQHLGVPVGGAMDTQAHRIANLLVANDERAAVLECALGGVALQFTVEALVALAGRDVTASLDGTPIVPWRPFRIEPGALLALHTGGRTTIAIAGGIDVPLVLDARGTSLRAGFGGWHGRALKRDDALPIGKPSPVAERIREHLVGTRRTIAAWGAGPDLVPAYGNAPTVRIIEGPELEALDEASRAVLFDATFRVAPDSDRMGYRLTDHRLRLTTPREMVSSGVTAGTIQLPPGGSPIVLMADRQTTGGYPRLGDVITADLPLMAQLRPGDRVRFVRTSLDEAQALYRRIEHDLGRAARAIQHRFAAGTDGAN